MSLIIGCLNRSTGEIKFAGYGCNGHDYTGCIVRSGEHAGQVAITPNDGSCDDTYYGCVNRETGGFEIVLPECCASECLYCGEYETPHQIKVTFTGITVCQGCCGSDYYVHQKLVEFNPNSEFILTQDEEATNPACQWRYTIENAVKFSRYFPQANCVGTPEIVFYNNVYATVTKRSTGLVEVFLGVTYNCYAASCFFYSKTNEPTHCIEGMYPYKGSYPNGCTETCHPNGFGGQAIVELI